MRGYVAYHAQRIAIRQYNVKKVIIISKASYCVGRRTEFMNVSGKSVLITGASRGLGRALALELAAQGARIGLVARPSEDLKSLETLIRSKGGVAFALPADVSDKNAVYPV